jgi:signal transduction histidine kinase
VNTASLPGSIVVDQRMIRQVLYNLLQNAVKFTNSAGTVKLSGGVSDTPDGKALYISVSDNGVGLDPANLERIFNNFEQVPSERRIAPGGTGLGLALCRRFVELHHGRIWAESHGPGTGTTFTFRIPIRHGEIA